jgi:flagellar biosynthesis protein FlhG
VTSLESLYDVLGVGPRASAEQIERAYRHAVGLYDEDALATYSLFGPEERRAHKARVQEAYDVLRDPVRRGEYDERQRLLGAPGLGVVTAASAAAARDGASATMSTGLPPLRVPGSVPTPPPPAPAVLPDPVRGADLRAVRERSGVSLRDIAATSKVGVRFLEYIESDRFDRLPAPVYLRGFVQEYARVVHLDPRRTADSYLAYVANRDARK